MHLCLLCFPVGPDGSDRKSYVDKEKKKGKIKWGKSGSSICLRLTR